MNTSIVGRHIELTEGMKSAINAVVEDIKKYHLDIIAVKAIVEENKKGEFKVEFNVQVANKGTVVITQKDKDFYKACDLAKDRLEKVLRRYHDKIKSHRVKQEIPAVVVDNADEEIVAVDLAAEKPMSVEEAIEEFKQTQEAFMVFKDTQGDTRVIYRRKDGKFGLY
ncbi:MAG: ribosome-associated translation inhibitor RaiA [Epsilonproteobacteria bacterium]|nr:ribosome-associated translation inhibitor RaiA [Campylobacterota bacterium]